MQAEFHLTCVFVICLLIYIHTYIYIYIVAAKSYRTNIKMADARCFSIVIISFCNSANSVPKSCMEKLLMIR